MSYEECRGSMHLDGVEGIEELNLLELEDEFSQDLLPKKDRLLLIVEENDTENLIALLRRHLGHEQLEVVDVELTV